MKEQIQDKLEKIDNHVKWISERMDRYFHALHEISMCNDQTNAAYLRGVAIAALDGEPTTADEYNDKEMLEDMDNYPSSYSVNVPIVGKETTTPDNVKWVSPHDPGDENTMKKDEKSEYEREHNCKHGVGRAEVCTICEDSENKYHDTNAQIVAYDKSMTDEEE
jgi:hypothetical protein|tara:strand:- start:6034 stop:6525 length:492 start_codon:yes stop_codon:yes gene_type:complete